jgi:hypothetical protein
MVLVDVCVRFVHCFFVTYDMYRKTLLTVVHCWYDVLYLNAECP